MCRTADYSTSGIEYFIVISIASGFIDERDEGVSVAVVNKIIFYGNGI